MEAVQGPVGLPPSAVAPRGLGTGQLESLSGYAARMSAKIAVPPLVFVRRALEDAGAGPVLKSSVAAGARRLNVGDRGPEVAAAVSRLTGVRGSRASLVLRLHEAPRCGGEGLARSAAPLVLRVLACRWRGAVRAEGLVAGARRCLSRARVLA